jgi:hypothetical protein
LELIQKLNLGNERIIFVEPSCGDGRLILELMGQHSPLLDNERIIGYDIDPSAIERSIQNFSAASTSSPESSKPVFKCCDFLTVTRTRLFLDLGVPKEINYTTVVFGGPPYTPKDLPEKFILHSIRELHAAVVVFLLPKRCRKDAVRIQEVLDSNVDKRRWQYMNKDLANITFDFKGRHVFQPSVLQFWYQG